MKLAVAAQERRLDGPVDPRFGRAHHFVVVETETNEILAVDNEQNLSAVQGAGIQAARNVAELGVEAVLTGHVGPKAFATLQAAGIRVYTGASGTVAEAVEAFKQGRLAEAASPDTQGHWA